MSVFGENRTVNAPGQIFKNVELAFNQKIKMDGLEFLSLLLNDSIPVCFFDPQYRGIMDKMKYGNEGARQKKRAVLEQMPDQTIYRFIKEINRVLIPGGHLFLWIDKFHLCEGFENWIKETDLNTVDLITWDKGKIGMGYRTRRKSEYLVVLQKSPVRAKGVWSKHDIPDVWQEKVAHKHHAHPKPVELQRALIQAVTNETDVVIDPAAGTFSVMQACGEINRKFLGCDLNFGEV